MQMVQLLPSLRDAQNFAHEANIDQIIDVHDMIVELKRAISPCAEDDALDFKLGADVEQVLVSAEGLGMLAHI